MHCEAVNDTNKAIKWKGLALALCVGALPFIFSARTYAQTDSVLVLQNDQTEDIIPLEKERSGFWDCYKQPVRFTYGAQIRIQPAYLWRGLYAGSANIQGSATVGYGGLYADMWWNIGVTDWRFNTFQPEVDAKIGFKRWGIDAYLLYVYNFKAGYFDMSNKPGSDTGNRLSVGLSYTVSDKLPLTILWETRVAAFDNSGDGKRAYSSYAEINYTQNLPKGWSLYGAIGITPWKSSYTGYQRDFAVQNLDIRVRKDWSVSDHCGMMVLGQVMLNPSALAADKSTAQWQPYHPGNQSVNANIAFGVYLK